MKRIVIPLILAIFFFLPLVLPTTVEADDKKANGEICTSDEQCVSNNCVIDTTNNIQKKCAEKLNTDSSTSKSKDKSLGVDLKFYSEITSLVPTPAIRIPGLVFNKLTADENGYLYIPWIAQYLTAAYKFGLVVASILAVIIIILQGVRVIISAGGEEKNAAYKRILQATIGLFICWGSYIILYTINPDLVQFKVLKVQFIKPTMVQEAIKASSEVGADVLSGAPMSVPQLVDGQYSAGLTVPPAASCAKECSIKYKWNPLCLVQEIRDMAYDAQLKTGYPAAVMLAQLTIEGYTFGAKCPGKVSAFVPSEAGNATTANSLGCNSVPDCGAGYTWECVKSVQPPVAKIDYKDGKTIDCGTGKNAGKGFIQVHGYACFKKPNFNGNIFTPLIKVYEGNKCFKQGRDQYGGNPEAFAALLQKCGYATAQNYAKTLISRMKSRCLIGNSTPDVIKVTKPDVSDLDKYDPATVCDPKNPAPGC